MRRRSKTGGETAKARHRKTVTLKRPAAPKAVRRRSSSGGGLSEQVALFKRERDESLEQQKATADVLKIISSSPGELEPVFQAILENAVRICSAQFGNLTLFDGGELRLAAMHNAPRALAELRRRDPVIDLKRSIAGPVVATKEVNHVRDLAAQEPYAGSALAKVGGARTALSVPMLREDTLVGTINIYHLEVRPFTDKQIEFLHNFAAQAVIAIENTRLLNELRQRTDDLTEALERQTATSEVLRVISSSPGELEPVFQAMLENAIRICDAKGGTLWRYENDAFEAVALCGAPPALTEFHRQRGSFKAPTGSGLDRMLVTKDVIRIADEAAEPTPSVSARLAGARSLIVVPMLKDNRLIGGIDIYREAVRPFADKQIALVQNFAAQAVIAIENTRLLNELRQRTGDLSESLEQQTATSEVLRVISSSPTNVQPVLDTIVRTAVSLCNSYDAVILLREGDHLRIAAHHGPMALDFERLPLGRDFVSGRTVIDGVPVHVPDFMAAGTEFPRGREVAKRLKQRTVLGLPLRREGQTIGCLFLRRTEVLPFTDKQIVLLTTFADQAVIAIENVRLFEAEQQRTAELTESLEQQTATADVLRIISSSPADLNPVFEAILDNAVRICKTHFGVLLFFEGERMRVVAMKNAPPGFAEMRRRDPYIPLEKSILAPLVRTKRLAHVTDITTEEPYASSPLAKIGGARTALGVPMLREDELVGAIAFYRQEVKPFSDKQIELVKNFAAQAVIAIENTRLLNELRQRTNDLTESLEQQTATSEVLRVISSSPGELAPVFLAMLTNATRICHAKFGILMLREADGFRSVAIEGAPETYAAAMVQNPLIPPREGSGLVTLAETKQPVQLPDLQAEPGYVGNRLTKLAGARTLLMVPLLKDDEVVGALNFYRQEVRPFTDKQIELVENFAAQAVIAIENARLLNELRQRTDDLTQSLENLRSAQDRLVQTEKLASLGQLTAGIAHEIKNPLNFVNNFSGVSVELIEELEESLAAVSADAKTRADISELTDTLRGNLQKVVQHGKRADAIVKNMLLHSRQGSGEHRAVDINALVEESLNLAYHGARAEKQGFEITLERSFDPATGEADVFPQEITRALLNLISNGFYAATKRKSDTGGAGYEPMLAAATKNLGNSVEITIRDNGTGIPPEVKDKLFNPFFTTKPAGEGTGLGLSISHDIIVKQHGGSIEVDTQPGVFTEIRIVLPRTGASLLKPGE